MCLTDYKHTKHCPLPFIYSYSYWKANSNGYANASGGSLSKTRSFLINWILIQLWIMVFICLSVSLSFWIGSFLFALFTHPFSLSLSVCFIMLFINWRVRNSCSLDGTFVCIPISFKYSQINILMEFLIGFIYENHTTHTVYTNQSPFLN